MPDEGLLELGTIVLDLPVCDNVTESTNLSAHEIGSPLSGRTGTKDEQRVLAL